MKFEIDKIAELARLNLKPEEKAKLEQDLVRILEYIERLGTLNVDGVEPTSHVLDLENVYRPDKAESSDARDKVLEHAPEKEGHFFKVPKVVSRD